MLTRRLFQAFVILCAHQAHAQWPQQPQQPQQYTTQTFGPGYSVTTGPYGFHAESHEYTPGVVTTIVDPPTPYQQMMLCTQDGRC